LCNLVKRLSLSWIKGYDSNIGNDRGNAVA
jgi:hypothetical protein